MVKKRGGGRHPYNRDIDVLFACTGNICRSPMAEALLRARLVDRAPDLSIGSFGRSLEGEPAHRHARAVVAERGGDLDGFISRRWSPERLAGSILVLTMERSHLRDLALLEPGSFERIFTLPEFVRWAADRGARAPDEPLDAWVRRVGARRDPVEHLRPRPADEIDDPIGLSRRRFRACAAEIDAHLERLIDLAWPSPAEIVTGVGAAASTTASHPSNIGRRDGAR